MDANGLTAVDSTGIQIGNADIECGWEVPKPDAVKHLPGLDSSDVAFEAHAVAFFQQLREKVRASMERDASTDAAAQVAKDDDDAAEMRDMYRARNAA